MNIDNISTVIGNYTKSVFKRVCSKSSPIKNVCFHLLSDYMGSGITVPGTIVDRILKRGLSLIVVLFDKVYDRHDIVVNDGVVDSLRTYTLLFNEYFIKPGQ